MGWNPFENVSWQKPFGDSALGKLGGEGPRDPYVPQYKQFNAGEYQGMDTSALGHALRQDIGQNKARSVSRLQGTLQRGGGGGADLISGLAGLEAQQGQDENTMNAKLAQADYEQRYNQWRDMMGLETAKANADKERYARDEQSRNALPSFLGQLGGGILGSFGGGAGAAAGSEFGKKMFSK